MEVGKSQDSHKVRLLLSGFTRRKTLIFSVVSGCTSSVVGVVTPVMLTSVRWSKKSGKF